MDEFVGQPDDPSTPEWDGDPEIASDDAILSGNFPSRHLVTDLNGHGTNVATQVSSKAFRLAGVTSKTTLMGVKVLGANGSGSFESVMSGILYAADNGADVANMSLGGGFSKSGNGWYIGFINRTFNYARQKGMLIIVSAGNAGTNLQFNGNVFSSYCDAPHVICVSAVGPRLATTTGDDPAFYTNFGKNSVDIAAPGGNADAANGFTPSRWPWSQPAPAPFTGNDIASWVWSYCAKHSLIIQPKPADPTKGNIFLTTCFSTLLLNGYIGTSQASPHVAGLAALLIAEKGKGNPDEIKRQIIRSAAPINSALGRGRIDVKSALGL
jgi:subtilisin family serine protease